MRFLWHLKLYEMARGFRVVIAGDGQTVTRDGPTVEAAFRQAEVQFVRKPPFVPFVNTPTRPDAEALDAVPELKGKHALVLYFNDDAGRAEASAILEQVFREQRLVRTVKL